MKQLKGDLEKVETDKTDLETRNADLRKELKESKMGLLV